MTKEEFEKTYKILESHFSGKFFESEEILNAYELWKKDYVKETMENFENKQRIDKVLQIIKECKMLMPHEFDWEEQVDNIVSILQGEEE